MISVITFIPFLIVLAVIISCILAYYFFYTKKTTQGAVAHPHFALTRAGCNPLISPDRLNEWEAEGAFNPAAVKDEDDTIHLFYRAIGPTGLSQIGYASTKNGTHFGVRSEFPVYSPRPGFGLPSAADLETYRYDREMHPSGGGWGGCEDPRAVIIGDRLYMTYIAFEGWHSVRIALTSIALTDMREEKWKWKKPILVSAPDEVSKNWLLFPEKINGKYAFLHGISPDVLIDYVDDLETLIANPIKSRPPHDEHRNYFGRPEHWDTAVRGAGAPPIRTKEGWLLLYHAMDHRDPNKYKLGAMILDINDPSVILYRAPEAILSPETEYENDWKPGIIYASGAVVIGNDLHVYYGGGDKHVCVAHANMDQLLEWLVRYGKV